VDIKSIAFNPSAIKVSPSATVTWTNSDGIAHNVTFDGAVGASGNFSSGTASIVMPAVVGTYPYHCTIHGAGMSGTVQVQ
jgi:plastocyanin